MVGGDGSPPVLWKEDTYVPREVRLVYKYSARRDGKSQVRVPPRSYELIRTLGGRDIYLNEAIFQKLEAQTRLPA